MFNSRADSFAFSVVSATIGKNDLFKSPESFCTTRGIICTPSEMICDARTCAGCRYLEQEEQDERATGLAEFLANCQHAKCKVVRLVRQQISKLQSAQYLLSASGAHGEKYEEVSNETSDKTYEEPYDEVREAHDEVRESYNDKVESLMQEAYNETYDKAHEAYTPIPISQRIVQVKNMAESTATASPRRTASPGRAVDRKWVLRILNRVRHRAQLILAAAAIGVIAWTALVYGVFLGANACGNGRTCLASSLKYAHAKRSLF